MTIMSWGVLRQRPEDEQGLGSTGQGQGILRPAGSGVFEAGG